MVTTERIFQKRTDTGALKVYLVRERNKKPYAKIEIVGEPVELSIEETSELQWALNKLTGTI
jgi:hypothetical protein